MQVIKQLGWYTLTTTMALAIDHHQQDPWVNAAFTMIPNQLISLDYPCDDSFLKELPKHPNLTKVAFYPYYETPTALKFFDKLASCPQISELIVRGIIIEGQEAATLTRLPNLTSLDLNFCQILAPGRFHLGTLTTLTSLHVSGVDLTDDQFLTLCSSSRKLAHLSASHNKLTQKSALTIVSRAKFLETLNISYNPIGDAGVGFLASIKTIKELYVDECGLSNNGLAHTTKMASLEKLSLAGNRLTGACIPLFATFKNLKFLDVSRCGLSLEDVQKVRIQLPNTKILAEVHTSPLDY